MLADIHIHSKFSFDSEEDAENYILSAQKSGVPVIGFSEHYDYDAFLQGADIGLTDIDKYVSEIGRLRKKYGNPQILCGIEFGYSKAAEGEYIKLSDSVDFDYIINSVHTLPGRGDSYFPKFFEGLSTHDAYMGYFRAVLESLDSPMDYQIVGHIGYVSRYRAAADDKINYADFSDILDEILKNIIEKDKCLEINTSTGKSKSEFLPDKDIIERYLQLGGKKLSFGSDAHRAADYMRKCEILQPYLKSIGVDELYYYVKRKPIAYKI